MVKASAIRSSFSAAMAVAVIGCFALTPSAAPADRSPEAGSLEDSCASAGLAKPKLVEAWVRHPGDRKTQSIFVEAVWGALPESCDAGFKRVPAVRFQLQNPTNHARWINVGSFVRPERDGREVEDELEAEKEAEGKSCWEPSDAGKTFVCDIDTGVFNRGGKAMAFAPKRPGWPEPVPQLERYRYSCTPGPGATHVRALIKNVLKDPGSGRLIAERQYQVPVRVKSYPSPPHPGHPKRAALQGPC
jgi:hypothetical protein